MTAFVEIWKPVTPTAQSRQVMAVIRGIPGLGAKYIVAAGDEDLDTKVAEYLRDYEIAETRRATAPIRRMATTWRNSWRKLREGNDADRGSEEVRPRSGNAGSALPGAGE